MTTRDTETSLDFTEKQIVDALRAQGWDIPAAPPATIALDIDGARVKISWSTNVPEVAAVP